MFEWLLDLDAADCIAAVETSERILVIESCRKLALAAQWADLHPGSACDPAPGQRRLPGRETAWRPGGDGTPSIGSFCPATLGCALGISAGSAVRLIGDALDVRHRLPQTWRRVWHAEVPGHLARKVAQATHHLTRQQALQVDAEIADLLTTLPYNRLTVCLDAAVLKADPDGAKQAAEEAMRNRFVKLGGESEFGLKWIIARATAGDAIYLDAMVNRLAAILAQQGDVDSLDERRATALGLLARPAEALRLLYDHAEPDDHTDHVDHVEAGPAVKPDTEPEAGPEPEPDPDAGYRSVTIRPPLCDPAKARPNVVIYVHLSAESLSAESLSDESLQAGHEVARMEGVGPVLLSQLRALLGDHVQVRLQPVIDLNDQPVPVDCYEIPDRIREHLTLTTPADQWPWAAGMTRTPKRTVDLDHTTAYLSPDHGGPPGQTAIGTLGPFVRYHHRVKTFAAGWHVRHPEPGTYVFRTPHGRIYLVNSSGTHPLGHGPYANAVWRAAHRSTHTLAS